MLNQEGVCRMLIPPEHTLDTSDTCYMKLEADMFLLIQFSLGDLHKILLPG